MSKTAYLYDSWRDFSTLLRGGFYKRRRAKGKSNLLDIYTAMGGTVTTMFNKWAVVLPDSVDWWLIKDVLDKAESTFILNGNKRECLYEEEDIVIEWIPLDKYNPYRLQLIWKGDESWRTKSLSVHNIDIETSRKLIPELIKIKKPSISIHYTCSLDQSIENITKEVHNQLSYF